MSFHQLKGLFCPACGKGTLITASDGAAFGCRNPDCPDRDAAWKLLTDSEIHHIVRFDAKGFFNAKHPLRERIDGELMDCTIHAAVNAHTDALTFDEHRALCGTTWRIRPAGEHNLDTNWVWEQLT